MVMVFHLVISVGDRHHRYWPGTPHETFGWLAPVADLGWLGVNFFFLISGFVICFSSWGRTVEQFAVSRVVRIFPAYWFVVCFTAMVTWRGPRDLRPRSVNEVLVNLTMLQRPAGARDLDTVFWTLWAELRFYLLFSVLIALGLSVRRVMAGCVLWLLLSLVAASTDQRLVEQLLVADYAPYFIAGVLFSLIRRVGPELPMVILVVVTWAVAMFQLTSQIRAHESYNGYPLDDRAAAALVTAAFVVIGLVAWGRLDRIRGRWLVAAGSLTYPLYLVHKNLGTLVVEELSGRVPSWPLLLATAAAMLALAHLIHRWVERPAARLLRTSLVASLAALAKYDAAQPGRPSPGPGGTDMPVLPEQQSAESADLQPGVVLPQGREPVSRR